VETLERYAAAVAELVLHLRDEGHILSPIDQHMIERWWDSGYPLETVLRTVRDTGERLKKRKRPPRGLPLKSMRRQVDKAGERALRLALGARLREPPPSQDAAPEGEETRAELRAAVEAARTAAAGPLRDALAAVVDSLDALENRGPEEAFSDLLAIGRRYYDACLAALQPWDRDRLQAEVLAGLGSAADDMDLQARDETVLELVRRRLREEDPILHPDRLWRAG
jgi:hypothetical protein